MKRFCILACLVLLLCACCRKYDASYAVDVAQPAYTNTHPRVLFDEAHHNHHRMSTSYRPFAKLLENNGFRVIPLRKDVTLMTQRKHHEPGDDSQLVFSRQNGLLADHEITRGVRSVMTFTGESVRGGTRC